MNNTFTTGLKATAQRRGFQTSDLMGNSSESFSTAFNKYSDSFNAIQNDQTRTKAEKAALLSKLAEKANTHLLSEFERTANTHLSRSIAADSERSSFLSPSDKSVALELAKHLKAAKPEEVSTLVRTDKRYAQALNSMPAGYFGITQDTVDSISNASIAHNNPDLYSKFKQLNNDQKQLDNMKLFVSDAKRALAANVDQKALETRFEPQF